MGLIIVGPNAFEFDSIRLWIRAPGNPGVNDDWFICLEDGRTIYLNANDMHSAAVQQAGHVVHETGNRNWYFGNDPTNQ